MTLEEDDVSLKARSQERPALMRSCAKGKLSSWYISYNQHRFKKNIGFSDVDENA